MNYNKSVHKERKLKSETETNGVFQDEQPLQLDHARMALLPSGALTIAAATLSDRATYRCRLENEAERRESRDAQLKINLDMGECHS